MSTPCVICPPPQDCVFPADLELYGLQGPLGPWSWLANPNDFRDLWVLCPPGWFCPPGSTGRRERVFGRQIPPVFPGSSPTSLRLRCCLTTIVANVPPGSTPAQIEAIARRMLQACAQQQAYCTRAARLSPDLTGNLGPRRPKTLFLQDISTDKACRGQDYTGTIPVKYKPPPGNYPPFAIQLLSGSLPTGMVDAENTQGTAFIISGKPTIPGDYTFVVNARDHEPGNQSDSKQYTISVMGITNGTIDLDGYIHLSTADSCKPYFEALNVFGGVYPLQFSALGSGFFTPPDWIHVDQNGHITGTPKQSDAGQTAQFFIVVRDFTGRQCVQGVKIPVNTFVCPTIPDPHNGIKNTPYTALLTVNFGTGPWTWRWTGTGALPPGLAVSPNGYIQGTPTAVGTYLFGIEAMDSNGCVCQQGLTILIDNLGNAPVTVECPGNPSISAGTPQGQFHSAGGAGTLTQAQLNSQAYAAAFNRLSLLGCNTCGTNMNYIAGIEPAGSSDLSITGSGACGPHYYIWSPNGGDWNIPAYANGFSIPDVPPGEDFGVNIGIWGTIYNAFSNSPSGGGTINIHGTAYLTEHPDGTGQLYGAFHINQWV